MIRPLALFALLATPAMADPADDRATAAFKAMYGEACVMALAEDGTLIEPPERHDVMLPSSWGGDPSPAIVWQFFCLMGAYNRQTVFLLHSDLNGLIALPLARPVPDVITENPDDPESKVVEVRIKDWSASPFVVNAEFDPAKGMLVENGLWRGLGDASHVGHWLLMDDGFHLKGFEVDATYDGAVNLQPLVALP